MWIALGLMARTGVLRLMQQFEWISSDVPNPLLGGNMAWGVAQLLVGLAWVVIIFTGTRTKRAVICGIGGWTAIISAISWWHFSHELPNWHGWLFNGALPSFLCMARHIFQRNIPTVQTEEHAA